MREIKFDIILWDGNDSETIEHYDTESAFMEGIIELDKNGCLVGVGNVYRASKETTIDECVIIRQYTGLKDKNGKEIYEGDIVEYEDEINDILEDYRGIVEFEDGIFTFDGGNPISCYDEYEVIGNIYENPEFKE